MWWRGAGWIPRRLDWLRSHHLVGLASFHFENASEGKKLKQSNHPGCQSAINWIAFQAKLWGWSMARKCLSTRLQLLLGCVCVCAYENESWHERLFCLAAAQWCKPLETAASVFSAHHRLDVVWGRSPRHWESRAVFARPAVNPSVRFTHRLTNGPAEEANDFQVN